MGSRTTSMVMERIFEAILWMLKPSEIPTEMKIPRNIRLIIYFIMSPPNDTLKFKGFETIGATGENRTHTVNGSVKGATDMNIPLFDIKKVGSCH